MTPKKSAKLLYAILFDGTMYEREVGPDWALQRHAFRGDVKNSLKWTCVAGIVALALAFAFGRADFARPIDPGKAMAAVGALFGAWATWFSLGSVDDTWDADRRPDPKLRPILFRVLFFPGLILGMVGACW